MTIWKKAKRSELPSNLRLGLVLDWEANDLIPGNIPRERSYHKEIGENIGTPTLIWDSEISRYVADFDGSTDAIGFPSLQLEKPFTCIVLAKFDTTGGTIAGERDGTDYRWQFWTNAGNLRLRYGNGIDIAGNTAVNTGQWMWAGCQMDANNAATFACYTGDNYTGTLAYNNAVTTQGINGTGPNRVCIGARWQVDPTISFAQNGQMARVLIWDRFLSQEEIKAVTRLPYTTKPKYRTYYFTAATTNEVSVTESFTFAETQTGLLATIGTAVESFTFAETQSGLAALIASATESFTFAETQSSLATIEVSVNESITLAEVQTALATYIDSVTESVTFSEVQGTSGNFEVTVTESLTLNESNVGVAAYFASTLESATFAEVQSSNVGTLANVVESFTFAEVQTSLVAYVANTSESVTLNDTNTGIAAYLSSVLETINLSDVVRETTTDTESAVEFAKLSLTPTVQYSKYSLNPTVQYSKMTLL